MQDTKPVETILGIQTPWRLSRVALDTTGERVDLWAEHADTRPACQQQLPCHDHAEERVWRHLDTCRYQTFLHAACHGSTARRTVCAQIRCRGPKRAVGSRC